MTDELHELFCFLRDHDCVGEATIKTLEGYDYKLECDSSRWVVTQTNRYCIG